MEPLLTATLLAMMFQPTGVYLSATQDKLAARFCRLVAAWVPDIDIQSLKNRLLKVCYVSATSTGLQRLLFLLQPLMILMKQTRQAVYTIKQSVLLRCLGSQILSICYFLLNKSFKTQQTLKLDKKLAQIWDS